MEMRAGMPDLRKCTEKRVDTLHFLLSSHEEDTARHLGCAGDVLELQAIGNESNVSTPESLCTFHESGTDSRHGICRTVHHLHEELRIRTLAREYTLGSRCRETTKHERESRVGFQYGMDDVRMLSRCGNRCEEWEQPFIKFAPAPQTENGNTALQRSSPWKISTHPRSDEYEVKAIFQNRRYFLAARFRPASERGRERRENDDAFLHSARKSWKNWPYCFPMASQEKYSSIRARAAFPRERHLAGSSRRRRTWERRASLSPGGKRKPATPFWMRKRFPPTSLAMQAQLLLMASMSALLKPSL